MKTLLLTLFRHWVCLQRLAWVPSPTLWMRFRSLPEYFRLTRLQNRILRSGGLYAELARVLEQAPSNQRGISFDEVMDRLRPLRQAQWVHPTALCLAKSLRVLQVLQAAGVCGENIRFRVGIRRAGVGFRGHAWVECDGLILLEDQFEEEESEYIWEGAELLRQATRDSVSAGAYRIREGILVYPFDAEEAVVLDLVGGVCFGLNGGSYRIWQELATQGEVEQSIRCLASEMQVEPETVRADVGEFVNDLVSAGLVRATT